MTRAVDEGICHIRLLGSCVPYTHLQKHMPARILKKNICQINTSYVNHFMTTALHGPSITNPTRN